MAATLNNILSRKLNDVTAERDALKKQLEAKNDSSESDELRRELSQIQLQLGVERSETQRLKEERDEIEARWKNTEMALEMMKETEKEILLKKSQFANLMDEEKTKHEEIVRNLDEEIEKWREKYGEVETEKKAMTKRVEELEVELQKVGHLDDQISMWTENYGKVETEKEAMTRRVKELEVELQKMDNKLKAEQYDCHAHIKEQENTIASLKNKVASFEEGLNRAMETENQLRVSLKACENHRDALLRDLEAKFNKAEEGQRQQAECSRRLQSAEADLARLKMQLQETESEKSHMEQQLLVYVKDFEDERSARESLAKAAEGMNKRLAESKQEISELRQQLNNQAHYVQKLEEELSSQGIGTLSLGDDIGSDPRRGDIGPLGGNMDPRGGNIGPLGGNMDPRGGNIGPLGGNMDPRGGNIGPLGGNMDPRGGNIGPLGGNMDPRGGNIGPLRGNMDPRGGNIGPLGGNVDTHRGPAGREANWTCYPPQPAVQRSRPVHTALEPPPPPLSPFSPFYMEKYGGSALLEDDDGDELPAPLTGRQRENSGSEWS